jgi:hypothetical protein
MANKKSIIISDPFWTESPSILVRPDRIIEFIITKDMELSEKLNALVRFFTYVSILAAIYTKTPLYLLIGLFVMLITIVIFYMDDKKESVKETFQEEVEEKYKVPTLNNPLMNSSILELSQERKPALRYAEKSNKSEKIKQDIDTKFKYNLYENFSDIHNTMQSQRQFYTMPAEFTANDANGEFKDFLYGNMRSKKEDSYENKFYEPLGRGNTTAI